MKRSTYVAAVIAAFAFFAPLDASAARCLQGYIYRPSLGVCQLKATYARQARVRYAKASIRHRYKRPPVRRAALPVRVTFEHHVYNWAYDNRAMLKELAVALSYKGGRDE